MKKSNTIAAVLLGLLLSAIPSMAQRYEVLLSYSTAANTNLATLSPADAAVYEAVLTNMVDLIRDYQESNSFYVDANTGNSYVETQNAREAYFDGIYNYVYIGTGNSELARTLSSPFCFISIGDIQDIVNSWGEGGGGGYNPN